jgi:hypothetical protein
MYAEYGCTLYIVWVIKLKMKIAGKFQRMTGKVLLINPFISIKKNRQDQSSAGYADLSKVAFDLDCQVFCTHFVFAHAECALIYFFKLEQKFY